MDKTQIDEFIQLLCKNELSIAALYETFATMFPASSKDWLKYAGEERLHAKWIDKLHEYLKDEKISFEQTKITSQAIKKSIEHIEYQTQKVQESNINLEHALVIAIDIEKSLLETAFLKVFNLRSAKAEKIQFRLMQETELHKKSLIEWQNKNKNT